MRVIRKVYIALILSGPEPLITNYGHPKIIRLALALPMFFAKKANSRRAYWGAIGHHNGFLEKREGAGSI